MPGTLKKIAIASAVSVAIIGASLTAADARGGGHWGGGGHWRGGGWGWGGLGVGLGAGLLVGAAVASPYYGYGPGYYGPYAYDYGYPAYGYADYGYADQGYGGCAVTRRWVSDGHGHRVWRRVRVCH
jgi:hypothetical protein